MEESAVLLLFVDDGGNEDSDEGCPLEPLRVAASFHSQTMHRVSISSPCTSQKGGSVNTEEKQCDTEEKLRPTGMQGGQRKSGIPNRNLIGGRQPVRMLDKAHMTSGTARNLKTNGKRSPSKLMRWGQL